MLPVFFILRLLIFFSEKPQPKFEAQTIDGNISIGYGMAV